MPSGHTWSTLYAYIMAQYTIGKSSLTFTLLPGLHSATFDLALLLRARVPIRPLPADLCNVVILLESELAQL